MPEQDDDHVENIASPRQDDFSRNNPYADGPRVRLGQSSADGTFQNEQTSSSKQGAFSSILGHDPATRKLMGFAIVIVIVLLLVTGIWLLLGGRHQGVPVIGPPDIAVKDRPADPGGMQVMSDDNSHSDVTGKGAVHLAPPPEQPDSRVLARQGEIGEADQNQAQGNTQQQDASQVTPPAALSQIPSKDAPPTSSSQQTSAPSVPATPSEPQPQLRPVAPSPVKAPSVKKQTSSPAPSSKQSEGRYQVQLGALDSQIRAERAWSEFRAKASSIVGSHTPRYQKITRNGKTFVRLRIGGFPDVNSARLFCARLHAQSLACAPVAF